MDKDKEFLITTDANTRKEDECMAAAVRYTPFIVGKKKPGAKDPVYDLKKQRAMRELLKQFEPQKK